MGQPRNIILLIVVILIGAFIFLEASSETPLDWTESYWKEHKKPYGAKVFHDIFTDKIGATELNQTIYEELSENQLSGNILFFNAYVGIGNADLDKLLDWISKGNTAFISAEFISEKIIDTLNLGKEQFDFKNQIAYKPSLKLDTLLETAEFKFNKKENIQYFKNTDTLDLEVLGYAHVVNNDSTQIKYLPNFVKADFGEGKLFLHLFPKVFTNYFLVEGQNYKYTEAILSELNFEENLYVDQFYKSQKQFVQTSVLQYLLTNKYLKWAYYIIVLAAVFYIFFEGKRKQKAIAIVKPFQNKTFEFAQTIAEMYYTKKDHNSIATKQIEHFFDHVREVYRIPTSKIDDHFVNQLASKSGKETKQIKTLLKLIERIEAKNKIDKNELIKLDKLITTLKS
jgi:hypothetical protein